MRGGKILPSVQTIQAYKNEEITSLYGVARRFNKQRMALRCRLDDIDLHNIYKFGKLDLLWG
jgi:hypothetical protein